MDRVWRAVFVKKDEFQDAMGDNISASIRYASRHLESSLLAYDFPAAATGVFTSTAILPFAGQEMEPSSSPEHMAFRVQACEQARMYSLKYSLLFLFFLIVSI